MRNFKLGTNVQGGLTVPEHFKMLKRVGWDAVFTPWRHECVEEWANAAAQIGLFYSSIHAPFSSEHLIWRGGEQGKAETDRLIACAEDCARFDIPVMVLHTINGFGDHALTAPTEVGLDSYARIVEAAERCGVRLAFENTECEQFLHAVMDAFGGSPSVGFCFDSGHEHCYKNTDILSRYGDRLCYTHLDDNLGVTGRGARNPANEIDGGITWYDDSHLPPLDGTVDFASVMRRIDACGYRGILTFELAKRSKPERDTHSAYAEMELEEFYRLTLDRARKIRDIAV